MPSDQVHQMLGQAIWGLFCACPYNKSPTVFGVYIRAAEFWKLPNEAMHTNIGDDVHVVDPINSCITLLHLGDSETVVQ